MATPTSIQVLPLNVELPWYTFRITLDGTRFQFTVRYNVRMDRWFLDIADASGTPILAGIPLLILRDLTAGYPALPLPAGQLIVTDDSGKMLQPTIQSFLTDHSLLYLSYA